MNKDTVMKYAEAKGLEPLAWLELRYPAFAVKVQYSYPTSDPSDFQDRALLHLIDIGIPYRQACDLLLIDDPHDSILRRLKSDDPGPQLVHFNTQINRLALTPMGKARVEREQLVRTGTRVSYIDGFTGEPFPKDLVEQLKGDQFDAEGVADRLPNGEYPFDADIEQRIRAIETKVNDNKGDRYLQRLMLPPNAKEISLRSLGPRWVKNLSIGVFLKEGVLKRHLFCGDRTEGISPFGYVRDISKMTLTANPTTKKFGYKISNGAEDRLFSQKDSGAAERLLLMLLEKEFGIDKSCDCTLTQDAETGALSFEINRVGGSKTKKIKILKGVSDKIISTSLPGLAGNLFLKTKGSEQVEHIAHMRAKINEASGDWHEVVDALKEKYPENWRNILTETGRHDLLFRHDLKQYIHY